MATTPMTKAKRYNPTLPLCTFFPCKAISFVTFPNPKTIADKVVSTESLKKLESTFIGFTKIAS